MVTKNYNVDIRKSVNYTKREFLETYRIKESKFRENIREVMSYFNLNIESIKRDFEESANYEIPYEIAPLLAMMISITANKSINPYRDARKDKDRISVSECIDYNKLIIEELEKLPQYLKNNIKENYSYKINLELHKYIPLLQDRLNTIFSIIRYRNRITAGNIILDIVSDLDEIINKYLYEFQKGINYKNDLKFIDESLSKEVYKKNIYINKEYNINSLITETYNKFNPYKDEVTLCKNINFLGTISDDMDEKNIEELRKEYLEELNLNSIDSKINVLFDNFDRRVNDKFNLLLSKSKYFEENKNEKIEKYINIINCAYEDYVKGNNINGYNYYIDIYTLENYFKYIQKSSEKEKIIKTIAEEMVEKDILKVKRLEIFKDNINKNGVKDSIDKSLDILLGQVLIDLVNNN